MQAARYEGFRDGAVPRGSARNGRNFRRHRIPASRARHYSPDGCLGGAFVPRLDPETLPEHVDRLYRAAWALCGSPHDAEDLVQETFARVLARPRVLRSDDELAYLMGVLRNTFLSSRRTASRRPAVAARIEDLELSAPSRSSSPSRRSTRKSSTGRSPSCPRTSASRSSPSTCSACPIARRAVRSVRPRRRSPRACTARAAASSQWSMDRVRCPLGRSGAAGRIRPRAAS